MQGDESMFGSVIPPKVMVGHPYHPVHSAHQAPTHFWLIVHLPARFFGSDVEATSASPMGPSWRMRRPRRLAQDSWASVPACIRARHPAAANNQATARKGKHDLR